MDRRSFIANALRALTAAGLGGGIGALVNRDRSSEKCINQGICRGCRRFETCHLPQAVSAKRAMATQAKKPPTDTESREE